MSMELFQIWHATLKYVVFGVGVFYKWFVAYQQTEYMYML